ncbi:MAG: ArsB/NhaD family transporter [bacterium]|nr:ArsB/NhaD family transporter [bacterium]MCP5068616.1 ArsB/NhaD family transporter [bacterium]
MHDALIPILVFLGVYVAITFELVNKAVAALTGVAILMLLHLVSEHEAVELVDFETITLLTGMMIIVSALRISGLFTLVSVRIAEFTGGSPVKILVLFSIVTAVMSAFLDNVTTVLIIIPIIIELTKGLGLDPKKFVISQALISNIGGAATLIGDPPNIIIGSKVGLSFNQFLSNLILPVVLVFVFALGYLWISNRNVFRPIHGNLTKLFAVQLLLQKIRFQMENTHMDRKLLWQGLVCLGLAIALFMTQTITGFAPGMVALSMAMFLLFVSGIDIEKVLEEVEWPTLMFFSGLFILVGVLEERGVIEWVANNVFMQIGDDPYVVTMVVLWVGGIASGFLDNIPFTITMIPIVQLIMENNPIPNNILWWALALGACLGGNMTMIGSSANIVAIGLAHRHGAHVSFLDFMKVGSVITLGSLVIASLYLAAVLRFSL